MPLSSPHISEAVIEGSTLAVIAEWLGTFFDGGAHVIGYGPTATFPVADLQFQEGAHPQPLGPVAGIRVVWVTGIPGRLRWEQIGGVRQQMATQAVVLQFWVRSSAATRPGAQKAAQDAGSLLYAILNNAAACGPMAACGIHKVRVEQPQLAGTSGSGSKAADPVYAQRYLTARMTLRYPVLSQNPAMI